LTVKETILIPGRELPPGTYVMKLMDSQSNRHIVQIMNEEENKVEATILAIPNYRLKPTGNTELRYWETPAGTPPALRAWFYPGDSFGQEFAYPKDVAERIALANRTKVAWYDGDQSADSLKTAELHDFENAPERAAVDPTRAEPPARTTVAAAPERPPSVEERPAPNPEPIVIAQNRPPAAPAEDPQPKALPQTASVIWSVGFLGCLLLATGLTVARVRQSS
jgi:hypothetical protein